MPQSKRRPVFDKQGDDQDMLLELQREAFGYFLKKVNPKTGLAADCTRKKSPASIASTAMSLNCYIVASARNLITRKLARQYTLRVLRFFKKSSQGKGENCTGYKGFYYHFLSPSTGRRAWKCELSTIDTALFLAAALTSAVYFNLDHPDEIEIRDTAEFLYRGVDWKWALDKQDTFSHGWKPETGFLPDRWSRTYNEAMILYILGLGSPTHPISPRSYQAWSRNFKLKSNYGIKQLPAGPLFIHQLSQIWLDLKGVKDPFNRRAGITYFENSRRAILTQQRYAIKNPKQFRLYGKNCWGITASDGPGPSEQTIHGRKINFYGYTARGAPHDIDDGTLSPWAVVASLPFAPEIVLQATRYAIERLGLKHKRKNFGLESSFNPTFEPNTQNSIGWISPYKFGLNQGPIILMIENYMTGMIWQLVGHCPHIQKGMKRAGFR